MKEIGLIPYPMTLEVFEEEGFIGLDQNFAIYPNKRLEKYCQILQSTLQETVDLKLEIKKESNKIGITLKIDSEQFFSENAYLIVIDEDGIELCGNDETGIFYAIQTLKQLLLIYGRQLPCLEIDDESHYKWRGMHIDVSRHYFSVDFIKRLLDLMALLKLNRFHWHLTDDQGWRIESKVFPKLTEIGAYRNDVDQKYGAFYTQEEIKEIVRYASERFIEVIPEIDLPGHTQAMLASYPELACKSGNYQVMEEWGISEQVLCVGKANTYTFIEALLEEIIPLFPSEYFHIGGDECPTKSWSDCPDCQKLMKESGLNEERALQYRFTEFLAEILKRNQKILIGWDEITEGKLPENAIAMCWRGDATEAVTRTIQQNKHFILSPNNSFYFDWKQSIFPNEKGAFGVTTLKRVYEYDTEKMIDSTNEELLLGIQANVWTEQIKNEADFEYMLFPRLLAIAEIGWSGNARDQYDIFKERVEGFKESILKYYKVNYCER